MTRMIPLAQVSFVAASLSGIGGAYSVELDAYAAAINGSTAGPPAPALGHRHFFIGDYTVMTQPTWTSSLRMQVRHNLPRGFVNLLHWAASRCCPSDPCRAVALSAQSV